MNTAREIIQFIPRLWAPSDGVADYARMLAGALREGEGVETRFLCGDPIDRERDAHDLCAESAAKLEARSSAQVVAALERLCATPCAELPATVLLHYANYGYATRGCPFWLIAGLERWKKRNPRARLAVMFHELYASGPPWRSAFWLAPIQRRLAGRLLRLGDRVMTSAELYGSALTALAPQCRKQILLRPVFSTIGEPAYPIPWSMRRPWLVVLGRSGTESSAYGRYRGALTTLARALAIEKVVDIGPRAKAVPADLEGIEVQATGHLPREEVSKLLSGSRAGFLDYPSDVLGKSTVFAAYCAHGVVPIITQLRGAALDGLREGTHFLLAGMERSGALRRSMLESVSAAATDWYRGHALPVQAAALSRLLA